MCRPIFARPPTDHQDNLPALTEDNVANGLQLQPF
jgi:hypothetical protein